MINDPKEFLKKCIEIYSPSGNEQEYAKFIANFLKEHSFEVQIDKVGNVIAKKGKGKPIILLISHLDTIPGELPVKEENGKIFGRGAVDCKPSLAAMVYSISNYDLKEDEGTIIFAGIVREEDSLIGIEEFIKLDINPDFAIFGEPTKLEQICIGYKGRICIGYRAITESGHAASAWQYVNAVEICLQIWNIIKGVCWQLTGSHCKRDDNAKYFHQIIPTLTVISGGELTNCVPSKCEIYIDIRFPPEISAEHILEQIRKSILNFKDVFQKETKQSFQIQENILSLINGYEVEGNELIVGALRWAIFKTIGKKPKLIKKTGTTFINAIGIHYNIPSITYGPGDPKLEHTNKEYIEIKEYLNSLEIYSKFFKKLFELYKKRIKQI
ncbi:MAG: M20/M25/M40 family metallo-hydrolase [Promethearchaeota archaeon]